VQVVLFFVMIFVIEIRRRIRKMIGVWKEGFLGVGSENTQN